MKLSELVTVEANNEDCVVLKVKEGKDIDLILLGCFGGDEVMFRLTKGEQHTCTIWYKDGKHFSWEWGARGYTLVSDEVATKGSVIYKCIRDDFGIKLERR